MSGRFVSPLLTLLLTLILLPVRGVSGGQPKPFSLQALVLEGDPAPPITFGSFDAAAMNDCGDLVFAAGAPLLLQSSGLFLRLTAGTIVPIALKGQEAPGTGGGVLGGSLFGQSFIATFGPPSMNDHGDIAFVASFIINQRMRVGIFLYSNGEIHPLVLMNQEAPGTGGGRFNNVQFLFFDRVSLNNNKQVAFGAKIIGGTTDRGIFVASSDRIVPVVLKGQAAPGSEGGVFSTLGFEVGLGGLSLNDTGTVVFASGVRGGGRFSTGIFLATPTQ